MKEKYNAHTCIPVKKRYKHIFFLLMFICSSFASYAQAGSYSFSTSTGVALTNMTGATTIMGSGVDDGSTSVTNIGFTFTFAGTAYTQFSASSNGVMGLGGSAVTSSFLNSTTLSGTYPIIMPCWSDMHTCTNGSIQYLLQGSSPNRTLTVQWLFGNYSERLGGYTKTVQVKLTETTNVIQLIYGANTGVALAGTSVGIASSGSSYQSVTTSANTSSNSSANDANTTYPASGRCYTFTPPAPPTITSLGSASGCVGSTITINGTNLGSASAVTIGGTPANILTNSATVITATVGNGTTGTVSVTTAGGSATSAATFTVGLLYAILTGTQTTDEWSAVNLTFTATGGSGPYSLTYLPSGGSTTTISIASGGTISVLPATTTDYEIITVSDNNGCSFNGNLLVNPSGASGMTGWNTIYNGGSGWAITATPSFISSFFQDTKSQVVDLAGTYGYPAAELDAQPHILVSEDYNTFFNSNDYYALLAQLQTSGGAGITSFAFPAGYTSGAGSGSLQNILNNTWLTTTTTFSGYGTGVRKVYFEDSGKDSEFWLGNYGGQMQNGKVKVKPVVTISDPLPVKFLTFDAIPSGTEVKLNWTTASEVNNDHFNVQRSQNGTDFESILHVPGAGNSSSLLKYANADTHPLTGISYYRLKQTDFNGDHTYSHIVAVNFAPAASPLVSYNPGDHSAILSFSAQADDQYLIRVSDSKGSILESLNYQATVNGNNRLTIDLTPFAAGIYYIRITGNTQTLCAKVGRF
ncbi:MAG: IPT/TIG domain-containing protein [Bacteroidia bacterium]